MLPRRGRHGRTQAAACSGSLVISASRISATAAVQRSCRVGVAAGGGGPPESAAAIASELFDRRWGVTIVHRCLPKPARAELTPTPQVRRWSVGGEVPAVLFRILGPLEVVSGHALLELGGPKQRAVLAIPLADALEAHRTVSRGLRSELGVDTSPWLQQLQTAIFRHAPTLGALTLVRVPDRVGSRPGPLARPRTAGAARRGAGGQGRAAPRDGRAPRRDRTRAWPGVARCRGTRHRQDQARRGGRATRDRGRGQGELNTLLGGLARALAGGAGRA